MLVSTLQGRFVSVNTEEWGGERAGRRDTIGFLDSSDGKIYLASPPTGGGGVHPIVSEARQLRFGDEVTALLEHRVWVKNGQRQEMYVVNDILQSDPKPAKTPAKV